MRSQKPGKVVRPVGFGSLLVDKKAHKSAGLGLACVCVCVRVSM